MRYNHRYHQINHGTAKHRRVHLTSLIVLAVTFLVFAALLRVPLDQKGFLMGFAVSLFRVSVAYLISLGLALALGLLAVSHSVVEAALVPILDVAQSFPSYALLPLLVLYFGRTSVAVIVILVVAMIWPILFNVIAAIKEQRQDQSEAAIVFGAIGWRYLLHFRWPMLRPAVITGSIISWGEAWDTIVGAEIIAAAGGAGYYLGILSQAGRSSLLGMAIVYYLLLIFVLNQLIWLPLLHHYTKYQAES